MKTYLSLLKREFLEWRTVLIVLAVVYALGLVGATVGVSKFSTDVLFHGGEVHFGWDDEEWNLSDRDEEGLEKWLSPGEATDVIRSKMLLFGWSHLLRVAVAMLSLVLMVVSIFYLADAIYNERSDGSTFFYRSLPVGDVNLLASKLTTGTVGFLTLSFLAGIIWVLFARLTFPGEPSSVLKEMGYWPGQLAVLDFIGDWVIFHFLLLLWLLPYAAYLLAMSTVTRSRPLLVGVGAPLLLGLLWLWILRDDSLLALFSTNLGAVSGVLKEEWMGTAGPRIFPGESIELFGSFSGYILSIRTLLSLLVAGGFFGITFFAYRRNLPVS